MENIRNKYYKDVAGYDEIIDELIKIKEWADDENLDKSFLPKGIIFEGYTGFGKTLVAKCFMKSLNFKIFQLLADSEDVYKSLSNIINEIKKEKRSVLFIDEVDSFIEKDSKMTGLLLNIMDGHDFGDSFLMTVLTTNNYSDLPDALKRCGRIDRKFSFYYISRKDREKMYGLYFKSPNINKDDINYLANETFMNPCEMKAVRNDVFLRKGTSYTINDVLKSYEITVLSSYKNDLGNISNEVKKALCIHEAGHALYAIKNPKYVKFYKAYIKGDSGETIVIPNDEKFPFLEKEKCKVETALAGYYAEKMIFHKTSVGCYDDLEKAFHNVKKLVNTYCERTPKSYRNEYDEEQASQKLLSKEEKMRDKIYNEAIKNVKRCLRKNRKELLRIAEILYEKGEYRLNDYDL